MNIIKRLRELEAVATPGPWKYQGWYEDDRSNDIAGPDGYPIIRRDSGVYEPITEDANLIIEMRHALPKLLAVVEAAEALAEVDQAFVDLADKKWDALKDVLAALEETNDT